jgi:hypothetical protein
MGSGAAVAIVVELVVVVLSGSWAKRHLEV